jgi:hypothetical protein
VVAVAVGELAARERYHRTEVAVGTESFTAVQDVTELVAEDSVAEAVVDAWLTRSCPSCTWTRAPSRSLESP